MATDPNSPAANYVPDYSVAGGYVPGQEESIGGGYVPGADASAADTAAKYADPTNIGPDYTTQPAGGYDPNNPSDYYTGGGATPSAGPTTLSSMPSTATPAVPVINGSPDTRTKLLIPQTYLIGHATGPKNELVKAGGIIFPYTPTINLEHKANYNGLNVPHSNYTQYFYKNSQVGEITISGKFTVQNENEAGIFLSVIHLLRALTKMRFGDDTNAGSPPPVCRLLAYGDFMLNNTPVAVSGFRLDLPDNVDYFNTGKTISAYGNSSVPTISTVQLTLLPIYSRGEMLKGTVDGWLSSTQRVQGYL